MMNIAATGIIWGPPPWHLVWNCVCFVKIIGETGGSGGRGGVAGWGWGLGYDVMSLLRVACGAGLVLK